MSIVPAGSDRKFMSLSLFVIASAFSEAVDLRTWMRSRFLRDDSSDRPDIVLKRRKWRRGTSPRALDLLLEIEEGIKKKETVAGWQTGSRAPC